MSEVVIGHIASALTEWIEGCSSKDLPEIAGVIEEARVRLEVRLLTMRRGRPMNGTSVRELRGFANRQHETGEDFGAVEWPTTTEDRSVIRQPGLAAYSEPEASTAAPASSLASVAISAMTAEQVAQVLNVSARWVRDHRVELGGFGTRRMLRFSRQGIEAWQRRNKRRL